MDFLKLHLFFTHSAPQPKIVSILHHCLQSSLFFSIRGIFMKNTPPLLSGRRKQGDISIIFMIWPQNTQFFSAPAAGWTKSTCFRAFQNRLYNFQFVICCWLFRNRIGGKHKMPSEREVVLLSSWFCNGINALCSSWKETAFRKAGFTEFKSVREFWRFCNGINALCSSWNETSFS